MSEHIWWGRVGADAMPSFRDPGGDVWHWDPTTHSYVKRPAEEIPDRSHASGGDNALFDPATQTERPKNPLMEGFLAAEFDETWAAGGSQPDVVYTLQPGTDWIVWEDVNEFLRAMTDEEVIEMAGANMDQAASYGEPEWLTHPRPTTAEEAWPIIDKIWEGDPGGRGWQLRVPQGAQWVQVEFPSEDDPRWGGSDPSVASFGSGPPPAGLEVREPDTATFGDDMAGAWEAIDKALYPDDEPGDLTLPEHWGAAFAEPGQVLCPNCRESTDLPQCPACGKGLKPEWDKKNETDPNESDFAYQIVDHPDGMPDRAPKRNRMKTDDTFPSMISSWRPTLGQKVHLMGQDGVTGTYMGDTRSGHADVLWDDGTRVPVPLIQLTALPKPPDSVGVYKRANDWGLDAFDLTRSETGKWIQDAAGQFHQGTAYDYHENIAQSLGLRWPEDIGALGSVYSDGSADVQRVFPGFQVDLKKIEAALAQIFGVTTVHPPAGAAEQKGSVFTPFEIRSGQWMFEGTGQSQVTGVAWVKERSHGVAYNPSMILVAEHLQPEDFHLYGQGSVCIVTATGGTTSHAALVARERHVPCVVGIGADVYSKIETGNYVKVDYAGVTTNPRTITVMPTPNSNNQQAVWDSVLRQRQELETQQPSLRPRVPAFAHVDEELAWRTANEPSLDSCPDCSSPMIERGGEKICHGCGTKQPIISLQASLPKQAFLPALLGLLGRGAAGAAAGGAGGGAGGAGLMGGIGQAMKGAMNPGNMLMGQGMRSMIPGQPGQPSPNASYPPQQVPVSGAGTFSHFLYADTFGEEEVGTATKNRGENSDPELASSTGIEGKGEHGDSPEQLKDVDGGAATEGDTDPDPYGDPDSWTPEQEAAVKAFEVNLPLIQEFFESEDSGADHPIIQAIDAMLEESFPGYKDLGDGSEDPSGEQVEALEELSGEDLDSDDEAGEDEDHAEAVQEEEEPEDRLSAVKEGFGGQLDQMGLVMDQSGNIVGQFIRHNEDGTIKILGRDGYKDIDPRTVTIQKAANYELFRHEAEYAPPFSQQPVQQPPATGVPTCPTCGQNHMPGTPCPTDPNAVQNPAATPMVGMQPMVAPPTGTQPLVVTHTEAHVAKFADTEGNPLKVGADYELRSPGYAVPDYVVVNEVRPDRVVFTISSGDLDYRDSLTGKQIRTQGLEFAPKVQGETSKDGFDVKANQFPDDGGFAPGLGPDGALPMELPGNGLLNDAIEGQIEDMGPSVCPSCGPRGDVRPDGNGERCFNCGLQSDDPIMGWQPKTAAGIPIKDPALLSTLFEHGQLNDSGQIVPKRQGPSEYARCDSCGHEFDYETPGAPSLRDGDACPACGDGRVYGDSGPSDLNVPEGMGGRLPDPVRPGADPIPQVTDLSSPSTTRSHVEAPASFIETTASSREWLMEAGPNDGVDVDPELMAKFAGKDFSPREQREFIDESGEARNLDKLDLDGTHYVLDETDSAFNW